MKYIEATEETVNAIRQAGSAVMDLTGPAAVFRRTAELNLKGDPFQITINRYTGRTVINSGSVYVGNLGIDIPAGELNLAGVPNGNTANYVFLRITLKDEYIGQQVALNQTPAGWFNISYHLVSSLRNNNLNPVTQQWPWGNPYTAVILIAELSGRTVAKQVVRGIFHLDGRFGYVPML